MIKLTKYMNAQASLDAQASRLESKLHNKNPDFLFDIEYTMYDSMVIITHTSDVQYKVSLYNTILQEKLTTETLEGYLC